MNRYSVSLLDPSCLMLEARPYRSPNGAAIRCLGQSTRRQQRTTQAKVFMRTPDVPAQNIHSTGMARERDRQSSARLGQADSSSRFADIALRKLPFADCRCGELRSSSKFNRSLASASEAFPFRARR